MSGSQMKKNRVAGQSFKFAGCQMAVGADKHANQKEAERLVREAAQAGAKMVSLPECWNSPYSNASFPDYAESVPGGPSTELLGRLAAELGIYLIGGSVPERDGDKLYNTSAVFGPQGNLLAKHRKVHLFDIDIPGKITFQESKTLSAGNQLTLFDTEWGAVGLAICYDMRFPALAHLAADQGAFMFVYPGAFNTVTGPKHWELLQRARAVDNQIFVATVSPARNTTGEGYQAWGHSSVVDPWGAVIATTDHQPSIVYADIALDEVENVRANIPIRTQRRSDLYEVTSVQKK